MYRKTKNEQSSGASRFFVAHHCKNWHVIKCPLCREIFTVCICLPCAQFCWCLLWTLTLNPGGITVEETLFLPGLTKNRMQITWVQELTVLSQVTSAIHAPLCLTAGQVPLFFCYGQMPRLWQQLHLLHLGFLFQVSDGFTIRSFRCAVPISSFQTLSVAFFTWYITPHHWVLWGPLTAGH